jgi:hypothetical protein
MVEQEIYNLAQRLEEADYDDYHGYRFFDIWDFIGDDD